MKKSIMRRWDLAFGIILMILAVVIFAECTNIFYNPFGRKTFEMTQKIYDKSWKLWYESPAVLPALLSFVIFLCGALLIRIAVKDGAKLDFFTSEKFQYFLKNRETKVVIITCGLLCLYVFVFIPLCRKSLNFFPSAQWFPFGWATFLYLFPSMLIFNKHTKKATINSFIVAIIASFAIAYGFGGLALIPLP